VGKQSTVLLYVADPAAQTNGLGTTDIDVADEHLPRVWLDELVEAPQQGRLPRSALTNERESGTGGDIDAHTGERSGAPEMMSYLARGKSSRQRSSGSRWLQHYRPTADITRFSPTSPLGGYDFQFSW
jgi:hypothetical protein